MVPQYALKKKTVVSIFDFTDTDFQMFPLANIGIDCAERSDEGCKESDIFFCYYIENGRHKRNPFKVIL